MLPLGVSADTSCSVRYQYAKTDDAKLMHKAAAWEE